MHHHITIHYHAPLCTNNTTMLHHAPSRILMQRHSLSCDNAPSCTMMQQSNVMHHHAPSCMIMHCHSLSCNAPSCTNATSCSCAPSCTIMHQCTIMAAMQQSMIMQPCNNAPSCTFIHHDASSCIIMQRHSLSCNNAPSCTIMQQCTVMHQ